MKRLLAALGLFGCLWAGQASAAPCVLPYVLQNGVLPDATQVMADFYALLNCINSGSAGLPSCSAIAAGLVPATGGGTSNFLRSDCTFVPPPSSSACAAGAPGLVPATGGGTANFLRADCTFAAPPAPDKPFDIVMFWPGVPPNDAIVRIALTRAVTCLAALPNSVGNASAAATASATININQVTAGTPTLRGTAVFAMGGTTATFSAGSPIILAAGDDVEFHFPASADATLADVAITLQCTRN
jgi:hypothetical protein